LAQGEKAVYCPLGKVRENRWEKSFQSQNLPGNEKHSGVIRSYDLKKQARLRVEIDGSTLKDVGWY